MLTPTIRPILSSDAPSIVRLIHDIGWQQTGDDIDRLLSLNSRRTTEKIKNDDDDGFAPSVAALGAFDGDGELRSCAALTTFRPFFPDPTTSFGDSDGDGKGEEENVGYAWLSYVATAPNSRRRGLARTIASSLLIGRVDDVGIPVGLYGSTLGAPLYESLGFEDRGAARLMEWKRTDDACCRLGRAAATIDTNTDTAASTPLVFVPAVEAMDEIRALDGEAYGVDRGDILSDWARGNPEVGWALMVPSEEDIEEAMGNAFDPLHDVDSEHDSAGAAVEVDSNDNPKEGEDAVGSNKSGRRRGRRKDGKGAATAAGFILGRPTHSPAGVGAKMFLGPLVAGDADQAAALLHRALAGLPERVDSVQMLIIVSQPQSVRPTNNADGDVVASSGGLLEAAEHAGFAPCGPDDARLMVRGTPPGWWARGATTEEEDEAMTAGGSAGRRRVFSRRHARPFAAAGYEYG